MNRPNLEQEARLQAAAELAEREGAPAGRDPGLDRYRLVLRALAREPAEQLPADFAARVASRLGWAEEKTSVEDWMMTALLLGMGIVGLVTLQPVLASVLPRIQVDFPALPWRLIAATIAAIAAAWAIDRGAIRLGPQAR